ncbi:MAG: hypothetical protein IJV40_07625 [Oscillospiraceae bacterium]|nr:hypothetical protein [Oscillospiraceae bacterium]
MNLKRILIVFLAVMLLTTLFVVAAQATEEADVEIVEAAVLDEEDYVPLPLGTVPYVDNDTAVRGEYTPFEPKEDADTFSGIAIEGNEEEELQQERIAGGAVGEATSVLEALHGITDYSEGEYVPVYGID